uniref:Apple domain-containing protein n=1 Tax=Tetradesmus obliquus TaxID=3088 RepID=A0A383VFK1_TETOB|eukprot:jgi/Sobl393_1/7136/SZX63166.1
MGFDGVKATTCSKDTYNDGASDPADRCKTCPDGRTTADDSTRNALFECDLTLPGWGWPSGTFNAGTDSALTRCSVGFYSTGGVVASTACEQCDKGLTTRDVGSKSSSACDVCPVGEGQGTTNNGNAYAPTDKTAPWCGPCLEGYYGDANRAANSLGCVACPSTKSVFRFYNAGGNKPIEVGATTEKGAASVQQCVAKFAPIIDDDNWYMPVDADVADVLTSITSAATDVKCMEACENNVDCQFFTWDYTTGSTAACRHRIRGSGQNNAKTKIAFKTIAASNLAGDETTSRRRAMLAANNTTRSGKPAAMGSGAWSWWNDQNALNFGNKMTTLSGSGVVDCLKKCNDDEKCAAVFFKFTGTETTLTSTSVVECTFLEGKTTTPSDGDAESALRSMIRYRTDATERPSWL